MSEIKINSLTPINSVDKAKNLNSESIKSADTQRPQMTDLPNISFGKSLVSQPIVLKANEPYTGKSFDVQAIGTSPIMVQEVTEENGSDCYSAIHTYRKLPAEYLEWRKAVHEAEENE